MHQHSESKSKEIVSFRSSFSESGEMRRHIYEFDWSQTPLGPLDQWPPSLKIALNIILESQHPMWIGWGPDLTFLYNDAYLSVLGLAKHPWALGKPAKEVWTEIWDICGPLTQKVMENSEAVYVDNVRFFMKRADNFLEEVYYSFSYSPLRDETGKIKGLICPCAPITEKILNERRLKTLGELSAKAFLEKTIEAAYASSMKTLEKNPDCIPFALCYVLDTEKKIAHLIQSTGVDRDIHLISPSRMELENPSSSLLWPIVEVVTSAKSQVIDVSHITRLPLGLAGQPIRQAIVLPLNLPGHGHSHGVLIAGVNPCRKLDVDYYTFYELLAGQMGTAIQNAQAYEDEKRRAEKLAEIDRAKTVFFSNVSHEFRTPLTLMLGPLEDSLEDTQHPLSIPQRERQKLIQRNAIRLLKLVNSLLDFSRIEANRIQAVYEPTPLSQLTVDLVSVFRSTFEKAGLTLVVETEELDELVYVDREMWEKIIFNLLSNAFKFTFSGGVYVSLRKNKEWVELKVQDTGVGISSDHQTQLFERFHRIEGTKGRSFEGTGIGLALIKELIKLHKGEITVESQEGKGSTFIVKIPCGKSHLSSVNLVAQRESYQPGQIGSAYVEEASQWLSQETQEEIVREIPSTLSYVDAPLLLNMPNILIADDNADMRSYLKNLLQPFWNVTTASDGEVALRLAQEQLFDLILTDVMMPKLDGFQLIKAIRNDLRLKYIPVILLSARAGEEAKVEGLQAGADDYLVKPFSAKELIARVEALIKITRIRQEALHREKELLLVAESAQANFEQVINNLKDGFILLDREWRYTYVNPQMLVLLNKSRDEMLGKVCWDLFPDVIGTAIEKDLRGAMEEGRATVAEMFYSAHSRWYENRIYPHEKGVCMLSTDITLRKKLEQEREEALKLARQTQQQRIEEAEEYLRKQSDFIDTLCHELRNPLNGIYGGIAVIEDKIKQLKQQIDVAAQRNDFSKLTQSYLLLNNLTEAVTILHQCARQQKIIVDDVLDLSKLQNNKIELNPVSFQVSSLIQSIIQMFQIQLQQKGLKLMLNLLEENLWLKADAHRLTQILINLISNAIKFTSQGDITVSSWLEPISATEVYLGVTVTDTGIGMTEAEQERLFDRFAQANRRTTAEYGGSGLGLAITKQLVEVMGGTIEVSSQKGQGSQFRIAIRAHHLSEKEKMSVVPSNASVESPPFSPPVFHNPEDINVLIAEDNVTNQTIMVMYIEKKGYRCQVANNGEEAVKKYNTDHFHIIFMDMEMPIMGGIEATQKIREIERNANLNPLVVIIGLSGNVNKEKIQKAKEAGMDDYLTKPCSKETLYKAIEDSLKKIQPKATRVEKRESMRQESPFSFYEKKGVLLPEEFKLKMSVLVEEKLPFSLSSGELLVKVHLPTNASYPTVFGCNLVLENLKNTLQLVVSECKIEKMELASNQLILYTSSVDSTAFLSDFLNKILKLISLESPRKYESPFFSPPNPRKQNIDAKFSSLSAAFK